MTYAVLLWPHANVRYFESIKTLAAAELRVMLRPAYGSAACEEIWCGGRCPDAR